MDPEHALTLHVELLHRMTTDRLFRQTTAEVIRPSWTQVVGTKTVNNLPDLVIEHLRQARTYHVSGDMVHLARHAATKLRDDDLFDVADAPSPAGFAALDEPFQVRDVRGNDMIGHYLTWGPLNLVKAREGVTLAELDRDSGVTIDDLDPASVRPALLFTMWNDVWLRPDHYAQQVITEWGERAYSLVYGRWSVIGCALVPGGKTLGPMTVDPRRVLGDRYEKGQVPWDSTHRVMAALFTLMNQTVTTESTRARASRATVKRAARTGVREPGDVTVVALRRRSQSTEHAGTRSVDWSHRWVVDGHWHRYRVGEGRRKVERRWVEDYVKGPEDRPLVIRTKVYDLRR